MQHSYEYYEKLYHHVFQAVKNDRPLFVTEDYRCVIRKPYLFEFNESDFFENHDNLEFINNALYVSFLNHSKEDIFNIIGIALEEKDYHIFCGEYDNLEQRIIELKDRPLMRGFNNFDILFERHDYDRRGIINDIVENYMR